MKEVELSILGKENPFELIGEQWMLITAGDKLKFNIPTIFWKAATRLLCHSSRSPAGKPFRYAVARAVGTAIR